MDKYQIQYNGSLGRGGGEIRIREGYTTGLIYV